MDTTDQNLKLGKWLKAKRKAAGLTPSQLAKVIGRPPSFIEKYEAGGRIEIPHLVEVATILKASLHEAVQLVEGKPNA
jgi:transcriptional regulator with XRE-family HTH domain